MTFFNDMLHYECMDENTNDKPLTIKDIREVLIPAMEEIFATKKDLESFASKQDLEEFEQRAVKLFASKQDLERFVSSEEFAKFRNKSLTNQDKMLKDLEILKTEKTISDYQEKKVRQLWTIIIEALQEHKILSPDQLKEIEELEIF